MRDHQSKYAAAEHLIFLIYWCQPMHILKGKSGLAATESLLQSIILRRSFLTQTTEIKLFLKIVCLLRFLGKRCGYWTLAYLYKFTPTKAYIKKQERSCGRWTLAYSHNFTPTDACIQISKIDLTMRTFRNHWEVGSFEITVIGTGSLTQSQGTCPSDS